MTRSSTRWQDWRTIHPVDSSTCGSIETRPISGQPEVFNVAKIFVNYRGGDGQNSADLLKYALSE
jgi:hypothetical protein